MLLAIRILLGKAIGLKVSTTLPVRAKLVFRLALMFPMSCRLAVIAIRLWTLLKA
jgi:hypothetical protein